MIPPSIRGMLAMLLVPTVIAAALIALAPMEARPTVTRLAVLLLGAAAAALLLRRFGAATRSTPEQFEAALLQERTPPSEIPGLRSIDQTLRMATASGFGSRFMLRPLLLELARWRLLRHRWIDLDATPEEARHALGEPLWRLIQDKNPSAAWGETGVALADLTAAVNDLERV